jgi:hypothetical protein
LEKKKKKKRGKVGKKIKKYKKNYCNQWFRCGGNSDSPTLFRYC